MNRLMTLITALVMCIAIHAQPSNNMQRGNAPQDNARREFNPELYKKYMREFVTREAKLTDAEAAKFFPLLSEMFEKQHALTKQKHELMTKGWKGNISEAEYEQIVNETAAIEVNIKKTEQTYYKKFRSALSSWQKVYAIRQALNRFQMEALKQFHPRRGNQQQQPNGNKGNEPRMNGGRR